MKPAQRRVTLLSTNYRELIEFVTALYLPHRLQLLLTYLPLVVIFGDLISGIDGDLFWGRIARLTFSQLIWGIMEGVSWVEILVVVGIVTGLALPLALAAVVCATAQWKGGKDEV